MITLVIIGVIAAITVPTLMNKTQNQEYVSKLKKTYSTLAQATNLIIAEEGTPKNGWATSSENIYNLYKKHLNRAKECGKEQNCWGVGPYKLLNGSTYDDYYTIDSWRANYQKLVLADGTSIMFDSNAFSSCTGDWDGTPAEDCTIIWVDVNGAKKPNQFGRDTFVFILKENGLSPSGCVKANRTMGNYNCNLYNGRGCACKVLREGAMNY
ncbi:type II secretion system protein [bacterium]|nr:type II secretion system protein [bacterium]